MLLIVCSYCDLASVIGSCAFLQQKAHGLATSQGCELSVIAVVCLENHKIIELGCVNGL